MQLANDVGLIDTSRHPTGGRDRRRCRGQLKLKDCALSCVGARAQTATMRFDNPPTDSQPHAGALWLGREERLKDALGFFNWKPNAGITYRNQ